MQGIQKNASKTIFTVHTLIIRESLPACIRPHSYNKPIKKKKRLLPLIELLYCPWWALLVAQFSSVQSLRRVQLFSTPWTAACQASMSITNSWSLLKLMSIESVMPFNHLILCCPLLLLPVVKNSPANAGVAGDAGLIPASGRSPVVGNGNLF